MEGDDEHGPGTLMTNEHLQDLYFNNVWDTPPIFLPNELGREPINILQAHDLPDSGTDDCLYRQECNKGTGFKGIALPPSLYPPQWEHKEVVRDAIIHAARDVRVELIKSKVDGTLRKNSHQHFVLSCKYGNKKQHEKEFKYKETDPVYTGITAHGVPCAEYEPGVREERMVGKNKAIRGTNGAGKKEPRWSKTGKGMAGQNLCPVRIRVNLDPGVCWYIPFQPKKNLVHCTHPKPMDAGEISSHANRCTDGERKTAKVLVDHVGNGGVTTNCMKKLTGKHFSQSTLGTLASNAQTKKKSNAAQFIDYLNEEVRLKKKRYIAIYHVVTETSLLAVSKAQEREELLKKKMQEAVAKKNRGEEVTDDETELTEEELTQLAGDLVKEGLKLYHTGRLKKGVKPEHVLYDKMHELLDIGYALDSVQGDLTVSVLMGVFVTSQNRVV